MPALPTGIITSLTGGGHPKLKQAYLQAIDLAEDETVPWGDKIAFQYWPESLSDSRQSEWNPRNIPGGSHPIYQWTHGGERRLSFTAIFTRDHEPPAARDGSGGLLGDISRGFDTLNEDLAAIGLGGPQADKIRNVPIEAALSWLRYFTYPYYEDGDLRVFEPPKVSLVLPGSKLGFLGEDDVTCVMTGCDITYDAWFPSGAVRIVEVSLEFAETVQKYGTVFFHNRKDLMVDVGNDPFSKLDPEASGKSAVDWEKLKDVLSVEDSSEGEGLLGSIAGAIGF